MTETNKFIVLNKVGLHARPAAKFVKYATSLKENKVFIENLSKKTPQVNAKSFTMVLSVAVEMNNEVLITIEGPNAEAAMRIFATMFETRFGEEE